MYTQRLGDVLEITDTRVFERDFELEMRKLVDSHGPDFAGFALAYASIHCIVFSPL